MITKVLKLFISLYAAFEAVCVFVLELPEVCKGPEGGRNVLQGAAGSQSAATMFAHLQPTVAILVASLYH